MRKLFHHFRSKIGNPGWFSGKPHRRLGYHPLPETPIILISVCENENAPGDYPHNGGIKLLNLWTKLLRQHGYEAYMVTFHGNYRPWLVDHQPHISIKQVREWKREGRSLKFLTGWIPAKLFIGLADELYFLDAELKYTCGDHFKDLRKLVKSKIRRISTHSRTQQAWYMATFGLDVSLIPIWADETYWAPDSSRRRRGLVGYMNEGNHTLSDIGTIRDICEEAGVKVDFMRISGDESEVINGMQSCDVYIGLNPGKHPLWGEGSPLTQLEAMASGCVLIAYDVHGNREYLVDGYNGFLSERNNPEGLAGHLIQLMRDPDLKERIRQISTQFVAGAFRSGCRWPQVREFLELKELYPTTSDQVISGITQSSPGSHAPQRTEIERIMKATAYIHDQEIPVLAAYASLVKETVVEIGAGYGASTAIFLLNAGPTAAVHSIDPFVPDSMSSGLHASPQECHDCVERTLSAFNQRKALTKWHLHVAYSHDLADSWNAPIHLLYLDGNHSYLSVRKDFEQWFPFVELGGYILIHDSRRVAGEPCTKFARGWIGPTRLAEELRAQPDVELLDEAYSLTVWRRCQ